MSWESVIGLEVHVQLQTQSKLFCACSTRFGDPPNTNVCPVCLGLPGALPSPNAEAVRLAVRCALALDSTVHDVSLFARKSYFYPDLPKGYQISQFDRPLATGGGLALDGDGGGRHLGIIRLHLEEDAGKSVHDRFPEWTALDYNRCGVPLVEIVTEPDLRTPDEARLFLTELKRLLSYIGVSDCNMEEGSLRVDANLSVRRQDAPLGTKQEVKNMNSFAAVERALSALHERQVATLERGGQIELTTYTARTGELRAMRSKEEGHDYRYFPDPDLPPLVLSHFGIDPRAERAALPELPRAKRGRLRQLHGLSAYDADVLTGTRSLADYFEEVIAAGADAKSAANWVMGSVLADANAHDGRFRVDPTRLAELISLVADGTVSLQAAKRVFASLSERDQNPRDAAQRLGLLQVGDVHTVGQWVDDVLAAHADEVRRYRQGEDKLFGFFMGELMRASRGQADPKLARQLLRKRLA